MQKAVILTSGGLDSTTCLALAIAKGFECYTLAFDYGQRHRAELKAAASISNFLGAKQHKELQLPIGALGGSALTDTNLEVPDFIESDAIPITYVPARNTIFLSIALAYAEVLTAYDLFIGVSSTDYSNYPDCRPDFINQFQILANLATREGREGKEFRIHTPLLYLSKAETIMLGKELGVDYSQTISCYRANEKGEACGNCDSCNFRKKGFQESGTVDPTLYK
jgi:7-cyano-7-deazaguanine synthase